MELCLERASEYILLCFFSFRLSFLQRLLRPTDPAPQKAPTAPRGAPTMIPGPLRLKATPVVEREPKPTAV